MIGLFINNMQAFDVWSYWREKTGEKARVWKKEDTGTPIFTNLEMFDPNFIDCSSFNRQLPLCHWRGEWWGRWYRCDGLAECQHG